MSDSFIVAITQDPVALVERAKFVMASHGYVFSGDSQSGTFSGAKIAGKYSIANREIFVMVTDKPFYVPLQLIELAAHELFA